MSFNESDASSASALDAGDKAVKGTGVFMPMVSRPGNVHDRSSSRAKPARRRNISTGSLQHQHHPAPARSTSSSNLGSRYAVQQQQQQEGHHVKDLSFVSIREEGSIDSATSTDVRPAPASTTYTASAYNSQAAVTALTCSASAGPFMPSPPPPQHVQLEFAGSAASPGLPQQVSMASTSGSPSIALAPNSNTLSNSSPFFAADPLAQTQMPARMVVSAANSAPMAATAAAASAGLMAQAISTEALHTFFGSCSLQMPNLVKNASATSDRCGRNASATSDRCGRMSLDMAASARMSHLKPAATLNGPLPSLSSLNSPLPSPRSLASCVNISTVQSTGTVFGQPSLNRWAVADALDSAHLPPDSSSACQNPVGETEEQIQQRIDELVMMKQLLQMKQQHKQQLELLLQQQREQQQLLQMQQTQQQSLLQQQMLNVQARDPSARCGTRQTKIPAMALQQELLLQQQQLLTAQHEGSCDGQDLLQQLQQELFLQPTGANQQQPQIQSSCTAASNPANLPDMQSIQHDLLLLQLQLQQTEGNLPPLASLPGCSLNAPASARSFLPAPSGSLLGSLQLDCAAAAAASGGPSRSTTLLPLAPAPAANSNCDLQLASAALFSEELVAASSLSSALDHTAAEH